MTLATCRWPSRLVRCEIFFAVTVLSAAAPIAVAGDRPATDGATAPASIRNAIPRATPRSLEFPDMFGFDNYVATPLLDLGGLREEDKARAALGEPLRIGVVQEISPVTGTEGRWRRLDDGGWLWTMWFYAPDAGSVRLRFPNWPPPHGAEVILYDALDPGESIGPVGDDYITQSGFLWSPIIFSDTVKLEYYLPHYVEKDNATNWLTVDAVMNHYNDRHAAAGPPESGPICGNGVCEPGENLCNCPADCDPAASCHLDVTCFPGFLDEASGVCRLFVVNFGSAQLCSGSILNRIPSDFAPMVLTAAHCGTVDFPDQDIALWFYRSSICNDPCSVPDPGTLPQTFGSVALLNLLSNGPDIALFTLRNEVPPGVLFEGWDANPWPDNSSATLISHPQGSYKRIAFGTKNGDDNDCSGGPHLDIDILPGLGIQEPGSSGGPAFDDLDRVRAVTSCLNHTCGQSNVAHHGSFAGAWLDNLEVYLTPADPIFVDGAFVGVERGTVSNPFNRVAEGISAVIAGSTVFIESGSFDERLRIDRPMTLKARNGVVTIGQ